jgi:hypothetical protein
MVCEYVMKFPFSPHRRENWQMMVLRFITVSHFWCSLRFIWPYGKIRVQIAITRVRSEDNRRSPSSSVLQCPPCKLINDNLTYLYSWGSWFEFRSGRWLPSYFRQFFRTTSRGTTFCGTSLRLFCLHPMQFIVHNHSELHCICRLYTTFINPKICIWTIFERNSDSQMQSLELNFGEIHGGRTCTGSIFYTSVSVFPC